MNVWNPCEGAASLDSFIACPGNTAVNRMTGMLANGGCYFGRSSNQQFINENPYFRASALMALQRFTFVGLEEFARTSSLVLQDVLRDTGSTDLEDSGILQNYNITAEQLLAIKRLNKPDIDIYYNALRMLRAKAEWLGFGDMGNGEIEFPTLLPGGWDQILWKYVQKDTRITIH